MSSPDSQYIPRIKQQGKKWHLILGPNTFNTFSTHDAALDAIRALHRLSRATHYFFCALPPTMPPSEP